MKCNPQFHGPLYIKDKNIFFSDNTGEGIRGKAGGVNAFLKVIKLSSTSIISKICIGNDFCFIAIRDRAENGKKIIQASNC